MKYETQGYFFHKKRSHSSYGCMPVMIIITGSLVDAKLTGVLLTPSKYGL